MNTKTFLSFMFGAAAGAAATYFFTSERTAETRAQLKEKAEERLEPVRKKVLEGLNKAEQALENL